MSSFSFCISYCFRLQKYEIGAPHRDALLSLFGNPVAAEGFSFALGTSVPLPDAVEVVGGIDQLGVVGEDAGLEVAVVVAFHAYAGACEVGGADVGGGAVENHYLEMHPWAESPFQPAPQPRILVEVLAEVLTRLFGMKQPHIDTPFQQIIEHRQERHHIPSSLHIQVLEVCGTNPQVVLHLRAAGKDIDVVVAIGNVFQHNKNITQSKAFYCWITSDNLAEGRLWHDCCHFLYRV